MASQYKFTVDDLNAMMSEASGDAMPKPSIKGFKSKMGLNNNKPVVTNPVASQTTTTNPLAEGE